jgi:hypothetical protein
MMLCRHLSERRACRLVGLSRGAFRNPPEETLENERLKARIVELAQERRRVGYRRIQALVKREQRGPVNQSRVYRLYSEANLAVNARALRWHVSRCATRHGPRGLERGPCHGCLEQRQAHQVPDHRQ